MKKVFVLEFPTLHARPLANHCWNRDTRRLLKSSVLINITEDAVSALRNLEKQYISSQNKLKSALDKMKQYRVELESKDREVKFQVKKVEKLSGDLKEVQKEVGKLRKAQKNQLGNNLQADYNNTYIHLLEGCLLRALLSLILFGLKC